MRKKNIQLSEKLFNELQNYLTQNKHQKEYFLIDKIITKGLKAIKDGEK